MECGATCKEQAACRECCPEASPGPAQHSFDLPLAVARHLHHTRDHPARFDARTMYLRWNTTCVKRLLDPLQQECSTRHQLNGSFELLRFRWPARARRQQLAFISGRVFDLMRIFGTHGLNTR